MLCYKIMCCNKYKKEHWILMLQTIVSCFQIPQTFKKSLVKLGIVSKGDIHNYLKNLLKTPFPTTELSEAGFFSYM